MSDCDKPARWRSICIASLLQGRPCVRIRQLQAAITAQYTTCLPCATYQRLAVDLLWLLLPACVALANCFCIASLGVPASVPHARNRMAASLSAIDPSTHLDPKTAGMSSGVLLTHITQAAPGKS